MNTNTTPEKLYGDITPEQAVRDAKRAAIDTIAQNRRADRRAYFTHREVELVAVDKEGERVGDTVFLNKPASLTVKSVKTGMAELEGDEVAGFWLQGGVDEFESVAEFFASNGDNYSPYAGEWGVYIAAR